MNPASAGFFYGRFHVTVFTLWLLDLLFMTVHIAVTGFNLLGWMWPRARRAHRALVGLTLLCWLGAGLAVGTIGYCPLTDWHWRVKAARGEAGLPASFIDYLLQGAGIHIDPGLVRDGTAAAMALVVLVTLALWWRERRR